MVVMSSTVVSCESQPCQGVSQGCVHIRCVEQIDNKMWVVFNNNVMGGVVPISVFDSVHDPELRKAAQELRHLLGLPGVKVYVSAGTSVIGQSKHVEVNIPRSVISQYNCSNDGYSSNDICRFNLINGMRVEIRNFYGPRGVRLSGSVITVAPSTYSINDQQLTITIDYSDDRRKYMPVDILGENMFRVWNKNHECYLISIKKQGKSYCVEFKVCDGAVLFGTVLSIEKEDRFNKCGKTPQEALSQAREEWLKMYEGLIGVRLLIPTPFDDLINRFKNE